MNILLKVGKTKIEKNPEITVNYSKSFIKLVKVEIAIKSSFFIRFTCKLDTIRILSNDLRKFREKHFFQILEPLQRREYFRQMRRRVTLLELFYAVYNYFLLFCQPVLDTVVTMRSQPHLYLVFWRSYQRLNKVIKIGRFVKKSNFVGHNDVTSEKIGNFKRKIQFLPSVGGHNDVIMT